MTDDSSAPRQAAASTSTPLTTASSTVAELAAAHALELLRFAYLLCGDRQRAEDLLQDVLLAMYRRFPAELPLDNPVGYARRALANANVSRARRAASTEIVVDLVPERRDPAGFNVSGAAERDVLWRALRTLPDRQRTVLVLRFYADATDDDIATTLGCRRGTVRSLASRALATLRADASLAVDAPAAPEQPDAPDRPDRPDRRGGRR